MDSNKGDNHTDKSKSLLSTWTHDTNKRNKNSGNSSQNNAVKQSSYDQYVKHILTYSKSILKRQEQYKAEMRKLLFPKFRHYFEIMSVVIIVFLFSPYNVYVKCALVGGFFANLIGLMFVIFKYAFSSSDNYYGLIKSLLKWAYERHKTDEDKSDKNSDND